MEADKNYITRWGFSTVLGKAEFVKVSPPEQKRVEFNIKWDKSVRTQSKLELYAMVRLP